MMLDTIAVQRRVRGPAGPARSLAWLMAAATATALAVAPGEAGAARHALIVGVSDYEAMPPRDAGGTGPFDLEGPKQDVPRMVRMSRELGVPDANLVVLANGVGSGVAAGEPSRTGILDALEGLGRRSAAGDQVLVYFTGHGSQMPDLEGEEDDGLDEVLLPADVGAWEDDLQVIANAITDDELGRAVDAIRARGAHVWVIVDSCHSGTALRGRPVPMSAAIETKGAAHAALGVPAERVRTAQVAAAASAGSRRFEPGTLDANGDAGGSVVAFYAATAEEAAIAGPQRLPGGGATPTTSLLTFAITEALASGRAQSYRDLALQVRGHYDAAGMQAPQPAFEGEFDRATFGHARLPPRRFPVRRRDGGLHADAGSLDGLHPGAILALRDPRLPDGPVLAHVRVTEVGATQSALEPVAHAGTGIDAASRLSGDDTLAGIQVAAGVPMTVRVARPRPAANEGSLAASLALLERDATFASESGVVFVAAEAPADLYLRAGADRLWLAEAADGFDAGGRAQPPAVMTAQQDPAALANRIGTQLAAFARSRRLLGVLRALEPSLPPSVTADVSIDQAARRVESQPCPPPSRLPPASARPLREVAAQTGGVPTLQHCDVAYISVRNAGPVAVDVTPLYFDRGFGISYLGSGELEGIRIPAGGSHTYLAPITTFDSGAGQPYPLGLEELVLVVVPRETGQEAPASYAYLAGAGAPPVRSAGEATTFDRLMDAAGFGAGASRSASVGNEAAGALRLSWRVAVE